MCNDGSFDNLTHPLNDLEWVRNELVEWVYFNLSSKWDSVARRGKEKVSSREKYIPIHTNTIKSLTTWLCILSNSLLACSVVTNNDNPLHMMF